jgi:hypothetical protein
MRNAGPGAMVGWCVVIIGICVPLALRRFSTVNA